MDWHLHNFKIAVEESLAQFDLLRLLGHDKIGRLLHGLELLEDCLRAHLHKVGNPVKSLLRTSTCGVPLYLLLVDRLKPLSMATAACSLHQEEVFQNFWQAATDCDPFYCLYSAVADHTR